MSVKSRNGHLEYRFMYRGQNVFVSTGLADTTQNRKLVEAMEGTHRQEMIEGRVGIRRLNARTFSDAWQTFIEHEKKARKGKPNTWKRIQTSGASLCEYFEKKTVFLITDGDVEAYKVWRLAGDELRKIAAVKPVTVRHDLDNLSLFFQWAKKQRYCRENLVLSQEFEKPSDEEGIERAYILSVEEERKYFAFLQRQGISEHSNLHDVGRLMIQQGLRPEEAMALPKKNVDLDARTLRVGKSKTRKGTGRLLKLTTESWQIVARRISSPGPWIFPSSRRLGSHINKLNGPHDRGLEKLKMNFVLYDLRHTFATRFIEGGGDVAALKEILGHKDIRTTMRYVHPSQQYIDEAMAKFEKTRLTIDKQFDERQLTSSTSLSSFVPGDK